MKKGVITKRERKKNHPFFDSGTPTSRGGQDERRKKTLQVSARRILRGRF
jgi:hypothetical protein